mgnify:CR=1 FL=1
MRSSVMATSRFRSARAGYDATSSHVSEYVSHSNEVTITDIAEGFARSLRIRRLFALTTHAAHWFLEQGFRAADVSALPSRRQALYNWRRGSKVFLKRL